jgi:carboxypeptidase C (cathepsin A)
MIVSGQYDYIVNSAGVQNYLNILNWPRVNSWKSTKRVNWQQKIDSEGQEGFVDAKGWTKIYGNLWFVMINGAGHRICSDQPDRCLNLLGHFIYDDKDWTN